MLDCKKDRYQGIKSDRVFSISSNTRRSHRRLPSLKPKTIEKEEKLCNKINFNKYYIKPDLRYRRRKDNPKQNP